MSFKSFCCYLLLMVCFAAPVFADDNDACDVPDNSDVIGALRLQPKQIMSSRKEIFANFGQFLQDMSTKRLQRMGSIERERYKLRNSPVFLNRLMDSLGGDRTVSASVAEEVNQQIADTTDAFLQAHKEAQDVASESGSFENPYNAVYIALEANLRKKFDAYFCNPESAYASADCKAQTNVEPSEENFIDFFTAERTWPNSKIIDVLVFARRFFAGSADKIFINQGVSDPANFISTQGKVAQANLRMAILNELAAQRAPTSIASPKLGEILLESIASTGKIKSMDYDAVCADKESLKITEIVSICTLMAQNTNSETGKLQHVIGQSAIDRILQFDYMMSPTFYNDLNSSAFPTGGSIEKVGVYLKAQQLAQDYRALRLLQMKTMATAMNMMNAPVNGAGR